MKIKVVVAGLAAAMLVALVGCGSGATHDRLSSQSLQSRWWTWAAAEPEPTNPVADQDGSFCGRNQPRDVWFLAGTFGTQVKRTCSVPDGVPVAFPLLNTIAEPADCADFMSTAKGSAVLDGKKVDSDTYQAELIAVRGVTDNPVTGTTGRVFTTGCGIWVQLAPLKPGKHKLTIRGQSDDFSVGVDYALTVDAP
ncbi:signal protein [Streptomyces sp. NPDC058001]|uniref:signal protein n=1 Tax=Streptomyces sp. NPDC058001 TaxID=3346300 RepID=UPI0036EBDDC1